LSYTTFAYSNLSIFKLKHRSNLVITTVLTHNSHFTQNRTTKHGPFSLSLVPSIPLYPCP
jgi:hypothetical protein